MRTSAGSSGRCPRCWRTSREGDAPGRSRSGGSVAGRPDIGVTRLSGALGVVILAASGRGSRHRWRTRRWRTRGAPTCADVDPRTRSEGHAPQHQRQPPATPVPPSWWIRSIPWPRVGTACSRCPAGSGSVAAAPVQGLQSRLSVQLALGGRLGSRQQLHQTRTTTPTCPRWGRPPRSAPTADSPFAFRCRPCRWVGPACTRCRSSQPEPRTASASGWAAPPPSCPGCPIRCPRASRSGGRGRCWTNHGTCRRIQTLATEIAPDGRLDALLAAPTAIPQAKVTPVVDPGLLDELDRLVQAGAANPALAACGGQRTAPVGPAAGLVGEGRTDRAAVRQCGCVGPRRERAGGRRDRSDPAIRVAASRREPGHQARRIAGDAPGRMRQPRRSRETGVGGGHGRRAERGLPARRPRADLHADGTGADARRRPAPERARVRPDAEPHGGARTVDRPPLHGSPSRTSWRKQR